MLRIMLKIIRRQLLYKPWYSSSQENAIQKYLNSSIDIYVFLTFSVVMAWIRVGTWTQSYLHCATSDLDIF